MSKTIPYNGTKQILQIYKGKLNACCCGCSGEHFTPSSPEWLTMFNRVMKMHKANKFVSYVGCDTYAFVELKTIMYIIHFT